jgi:hypothetical protein
MKNAIIFHGQGGTPNSFWIPWLKHELENKGYAVKVPQLPDADNPSFQSWLPTALAQGPFDSETIIIGHSAGVPLILRLLENIQVKIKQIILVAGFCTPLGSDTSDPIINPKWNWKKIRENVGDIVIINSDNDPWGCDDKQGKTMHENLGGKQIVLHEGHFGSDTFKQPYDTFPLLLKLID